MGSIVADYLKTLFCLAAIAAVTATTISIAVLILKTDFAALLFH
jgi:hypothetical protein